jgi:hypothetical protein
VYVLIRGRIYTGVTNVTFTDCTVQGNHANGILIDPSAAGGILNIPDTAVAVLADYQGNCDDLDIEGGPLTLQGFAPALLPTGTPGACL